MFLTFFLWAHLFWFDQDIVERPHLRIDRPQAQLHCGKNANGVIVDCSVPGTRDF